ncbi:C2HC5 finger protein [Venturia nashicola]|uniref:C2HC5 finger protein n=1 Tax=Venturia nashicola TaxID=86259 RepID=A0A4Z1NYG6_9PEZI|nr:C2HC5 finger protein [Venturia nashicola]TLD23694.1 C2HC5 finger protein [Venturia nashicola]
MALHKWALPQLSKLLPIDDESLKQIISYTETLSKETGAEHLKNMLGDSPQAIEFITTFNSRRQAPASGSSYASASRPEPDLSAGVPKSKPRQRKKNDFNKLPPPRRPEQFGDVAGAYIKPPEQDYLAGASKNRKQASQASAFSLSATPEALQLPLPASNGSPNMPSRATTSRLPPSAAGRLISDTSKPNSRSASPAPKSKTKVSIAGGTPMHGQSTALSDLESAIRELEIQTNPSLAQDNKRRKCNCMAQRHAILEAAPNCLSCGKVVCVKEGLGPCTFCNAPLLSSNEIQSMIRILREERGKEKQSSHNNQQRKAEVSKTPRPFASSHLATPGALLNPSSNNPSDTETDPEVAKLAAAKAHRDRLLTFQANNAKRTRIHDEAADFELPTSGTNMWATPAERALQLKRQQKVLREQEWNARPEWEKKRIVASIDLAGGKVVKRMERTQRPKSESEGSVEEEERDERLPQEMMRGEGKGALSKNPLMGGLIRPVARVREDGGKGKGKGKKKQNVGERSTWRRVQDDNEDNERWILDGGLHGQNKELVEKSQEPSCG